MQKIRGKEKNRVSNNELIELLNFTKFKTLQEFMRSLKSGATKIDDVKIIKK